MARKDGTPAMRARTEYAYSTEVYGTLQRMLAKLLEAMPEKPLHYMVDFLSEEIKRAERVAAPAPAPAPEPEPAAPPASAAPEPADEEAEEVEAAPAKIEGKNIIFVLGGPGSGKGTQCERIVADFGFDHFSAGDLLRAEVTSGSEVGIMCANLMKEGKLVPASVTMGLLRKSIEASTASAILVDGFPRALDQSTVFEKTICESKVCAHAGACAFENSFRARSKAPTVVCRSCACSAPACSCGSILTSSLCAQTNACVCVCARERASGSSPSISIAPRRP